MYEYITSHGKLNQYHLKKIEQTIDKALSEHPRVLAVRVDLHTPVLKPLNDMPDEANFARTDSSVISRFTDSLKAKISHYLNKREKEGKRVRKTSLRVVWAREFAPDSHKKTLSRIIVTQRGHFQYTGSVR
ncbi:YagK/YfjJ domain-containing protein [Raoultella ornithinolytica]